MKVKLEIVREARGPSGGPGGVDQSLACFEVVGEDFADLTRGLDEIVTRARQWMGAGAAETATRSKRETAVARTEVR